MTSGYTEPTERGVGDATRKKQYYNRAGSALVIGHKPSQQELPVGLSWSAHLDEDLPQGDEGRAELRQKQAADEEVPLVLPEELGDTQTKAWKLKQPTSKDSSFYSRSGIPRETL